MTFVASYVEGARNRADNLFFQFPGLIALLPADYSVSLKPTHPATVHRDGLGSSGDRFLLA